MSIIHDLQINEKIKKIFESKKFQLCLYLAKLFIQYLHLKPHWIYAWENEKNNLKLKKSHIWQKKIWNQLIKKIKNNSFTQLIQNLFLTINKKKINNYLPSNIFIISLENDTPFNYFMLSIISKHIVIHKYQYILVKNTYNKISKKLLQRIKIKKPLYIPTIAIKIIKKFFFIKKKKTKKIYLLQQLQSDIFDSKSKKKKNKIIYHTYDNSISIHQCFSIYQEVEVLYNYITQKMNSDTTIQPHNILITAVNIKKYIPYINNIFQYKKDNYLFLNKKKIDRTFEKKIFLKIKNLLKIKNNYFQYSWILSLLDLSLIRKKFSIKSTDIPVIYSLILKLGVYWGFDLKHLKNMSLPKIEKYTWDYAVKKIISGIFFKVDNYSWNNIFPYNLSYDQGNILLGNFIELILYLKKLYKNISTNKKLKSWLKLIPNIIKNFFQVPNKYKLFFNQLKRHWKNIIIHGINNHYPKKISIDTLMSEFFKKNILNKNNFNFMSGTLNYFELNKIKNIPFKMICMLGCHQEILSEKKNILNLIQKNKYNQYSLATDDHQKIFLNIIMSAKNYLYYSYISQKIDNNYKKNTPQFIYTILSYIQKNFYYNRNEQNNTIRKDHNILHYILYNYKNNINTDKKKNKKNPLNQDLKDSSVHKEKNKNTQGKINFFISKEIKLKKLIQFWKDPIKYFFNKTLKININPYAKNILLDNEIFSVDFIEKYKIKKKILSILLKRKKTKELFCYYKEKGKIPYGSLGKIFWKKQKEKVKKLANKINTKRNLSKKIKINLIFKKHQLTGKLSEINHYGLIRWTVTKINYYNTIALWLEHLVYCTLGYNKKSTLFSINGKMLKFTFLKKSKAREYLNRYIHGYRTGIKKPILFLKSGLNWLTYNYIKNKLNIKKTSCKKFLETWNGSFQYPGEKDNIFIKKIIPALNKKDIQKICNTCKYWYQPILKHQKIKSWI